MKFAINYVLGATTRLLVVDAEDRDDAYDKARDTLRSLSLVSASLQGSARAATQDEIDCAQLCGRDPLAPFAGVAHATVCPLKYRGVS